VGHNSVVKTTAVRYPYQFAQGMAYSTSAYPDSDFFFLFNQTLKMMRRAFVIIMTGRKEEDVT